MTTAVEIIEAVDGDIGRFLGMNPPEILGYTVVEKLDRQGIEAWIPDRLPFLSMEKAVILESPEGQLKTLAVCGVTRQECEGHFGNNYVILPLLFLVKAMALTGSLLAAYLKKDNSVALAVGSGRVYMPEEGLIIPPANVLVEVDPISLNKHHCFARATTWIDGKQVAVIEDLDYLLMKKAVFSRFYERISRKEKTVVGL